MTLGLRRGLVVEDFSDAAVWLCAALEQAFPGIRVERAATLAQGRQLLDAWRPEIALIDLNLPDGVGLELVAEAHSRKPPIPVIVTTVYDDDEHIFPALRAGACGYLLKEESRETLVTHIVDMMRGELPLSPTVARQVMRYFSEPPVDVQGVDSLTARETEILTHIAGGATAQEVAEQLGISRNTVLSHIKHVYDKLGVSTRAEATIIAARLGLIRF